jgi:lipid-A-disaccharide synthase
MLGVVGRFKREFPDFGYLMPVAPNVDISEYREHVDALEQEGVLVRKENAAVVYSASEAAVVASGTAALQAVFRATPLVVVYRLFPLSYLIGRMIIRVKYANIANIILDRMAVPELLQGRANPDDIMGELRPLVSDPGRRQKMLQDLGAVKALFEGRRPSRRVAESAGELAGWA